jgi:hypothetical protein
MINRGRWVFIFIVVFLPMAVQALPSIHTYYVYFIVAYDDPKVVIFAQDLVKIVSEDELSESYFKNHAMYFDIILFDTLRADAFGDPDSWWSLNRTYDYIDNSTQDEAIESRTRLLTAYQEEGYTVYSVDYHIESDDVIYVNFLSPLKASDCPPLPDQFRKSKSAQEEPTNETENDSFAKLLLEAESGRVTFWASKDVGVMKIYVDGNYIGSLKGYLDSSRPDCSFPQTVFPSVDLLEGTYSYEGVGEPGYTQQLKVKGSFATKAGGCILIEIMPPREE